MSLEDPSGLECIVSAIECTHADMVESNPNFLLLFIAFFSFGKTYVGRCHFEQKYDL
jgi:hypothetical protein